MCALAQKDNNVHTVIVDWRGAIGLLVRAGGYY